MTIKPVKLSPRVIIIVRLGFIMASGPFRPHRNDFITDSIHLAWLHGIFIAMLAKNDISDKPPSPF